MMGQIASSLAQMTNNTMTSAELLMSIDDSYRMSRIRNQSVHYDIPMTEVQVSQLTAIFFFIRFFQSNWSSGYKLFGIDIFISFDIFIGWLGLMFYSIWYSFSVWYFYSVFKWFLSGLDIFIRIFFVFIPFDILLWFHIFYQFDNFIRLGVFIPFDIHSFIGLIFLFGSIILLGSIFFIGLIFSFYLIFFHRVWCFYILGLKIFIFSASYSDSE